MVGGFHPIHLLRLTDGYPSLIPPHRKLQRRPTHADPQPHSGLYISRPARVNFGPTARNTLNSGARSDCPISDWKIKLIHGQRKG